MATQIAPQISSQPVADSAPLKPLEPHVIDGFSIGVGERLRDSAAHGVGEAQVLDAIHRERLALVTALNSPELRQAFAASYHRTHGVRMPGAAASFDGVQRATDEVLDHRINEARWLARLVGDVDFVAASHAAPPKPATYQLAPEKIAEMIERFAEDKTRLGPDALLHAIQNMEGERMGHAALVETFAEGGALQQVLAQQLTAQLPPEVAQHVAAEWIKARREPAQATVETLAEGGIVYRAVLERIEAAAQPAPVMQGQAVHAGAVQPQSVMMDSLG